MLNNSKKVEDRISRPRDHQDLQKMQDLLNEKNTYMNYYKKEEVKTKERFHEHTTT